MKLFSWHDAQIIISIGFAICIGLLSLAFVYPAWSSYQEIGMVTKIINHNDSFMTILGIFFIVALGLLIYTSIMCRKIRMTYRVLGLSPFPVLVFVYALLYFFDKYII